MTKKRPFYSELYLIRMRRLASLTRVFATAAALYGLENHDLKRRHHKGARIEVKEATAVAIHAAMEVGFTRQEVAYWLRVDRTATYHYTRMSAHPTNLELTKNLWRQNEPNPEQPGQMGVGVSDTGVRRHDSNLADKTDNHWVNNSK